MAESAPLEDEFSPTAAAAEDEAALLARHSREAKELRGIYRISRPAAAKYIDQGLQINYA